ncbi:hypothetical protein [Blastococcus sp. TF02A-35]|uniref:hypothetical protein n=1 Tax=Blastococcus sp. TF02A-35 TaxID=2559612 RepID=UPI001073BC76|nr:hypothetical protein [Blastococcus sp. TF02A_35]TFV45991.1 hypothetical protein E4P43_16900 [Blastococcus sp. TF02A_35]
MRIRKLALVAAATALPFSLTACGGAGVEDFCEQYEAIDQIEDEDVDQAKDAFDELADNVPDDAGDDVKEAATFMADNFPEDGDFEQAVESGDFDQETAEKFATSAETVQGYGEENCGS